MGHPYNAANNVLINRTGPLNDYATNINGSYYSFAGIDFISSFVVKRSDLFLNNNRLFEYGFLNWDRPGVSNPQNTINDTGQYPATSGLNNPTNFTYNMSTAGDTTGWEQIIITRDPESTVEPGYGMVRMYRNGVRFVERYSSLNYAGAFILINPVEKWLMSTGGWGVVRGYNKAFTDAEALGQYNAQKGRFGI
tara:strand:- start:297 stop:878 length:582 start_codon:yes stop_codon:yes gene_type:complete